METNEPRELLTQVETSKELHVCTRTVRRLEALGKLPRVQLMGCVRYRREDVRRLIEDHAQTLPESEKTTAP
jgi:hypothetical protein